MPVILSIETSASTCSVAIANDGRNISVKENHVDKSHASILNVLIMEAVAESGIPMGKIDAVAVSKGPGSYTGLRIGVSSAKGICYALNKPLIAVDTLKIMAIMASQVFLQKLDEELLICPMIDARRDEVYTALFNSRTEKLNETTAVIISPDFFGDIDPEIAILCCGSGAPKCNEIVKRKNVVFSDSIFPSAEFMCQPALDLYSKACFEDVAYFEPYYLKDFIATVPKNKIPGIIAR